MTLLVQPVTPTPKQNDAQVSLGQKRSLMNLKTAFSAGLVLLISVMFGQIATEPLLMMQNTMHTDRISSISIDSLQTVLLTSSADKSARLWDLSDGRLRQVLRPPIGLERIGRLHAAALSPDKRFAAVGGHDEEGGLYVFALDTMDIVFRKGALADRINQIEFSPDGRYLAVGLITREVLIMDSRDWNLVAVLEFGAVRVGGLSFAGDGRLAVTCQDGRVRIYSSDFNSYSQYRFPDGSKPFMARFSPDGSKLALSFSESFRIAVLDSYELKMLYEPNTSAMVGEIYEYLIPSFSADSQTLYAGGSCQAASLPGSRYTIRAWKDQGRGEYADISVSNNSITDLAPRHKGGIFFCGMAPDWGILNADNQIEMYHAPEINDFNLWDKLHLRVNASGSEVGFTSWGSQPREFRLADRIVYEWPSVHPAFTDSSDVIKITNWDQSFRPRLNGRGMSFLRDEEQNLCVDVVDGGRRLLFGTIWNLYCLDAQGAYLWEVSAPAMVMAVKASGDGRLAVAALSDGTIRWYRMEDGQLLMTLFSSRDQARWILYTPEGYYDCSPGSETMIGWQLNQGYEQPSIFYPVEKFREEFYRPDLMKTLLVTLDSRQSLMLASEETGEEISSKDIKSALPPRLEILSPIDGSSYNSPEVTFTYRLTDPANHKVKAIKVKVDNFSVLNIKDPLLTNGVGSFTLKLQPRNTRIKISAEGGRGIDVKELSLKWAGDESKIVSLPKPRLFVLAVGVAAYQNSIKRLNFPPKDASDFANALQLMAKPMYDSLAVRIITDSRATLRGVIEGFDWIASLCGPSDVAMIFLSGHGTADKKGMYHFVTVDADADSIESTCLSYSVLEEKLKAIAGKVVLFTDTCHAGGIYDDPRFRLPDTTGLVNRVSSDEVSVVVFASSTASQLSQEKVAWNNGAFTKVLVEGLLGKADLLGKKEVTFKGLDYYIAAQVKELTQNSQSPVTMPARIPDFVMIKLRDQ